MENIKAASAQLTTINQITYQLVQQPCKLETDRLSRPNRPSTQQVNVTSAAQTKSLFGLVPTLPSFIHPTAVALNPTIFSRNYVSTIGKDPETKNRHKHEIT